MEFVTEISRIFIPIVTVIIFTKCTLTLWLGHPKEKTYGYIVDKYDDESYELNMWETSIGRSTSCDISINYDTMPRFAAVISRRNDSWYVHDLNSKVGVKVNGIPIKNKETIKHGDILSFGRMRFQFVIADDPVVKVGRKKKNKPQAKKAMAQKKTSNSPQPSSQRKTGAANQVQKKPTYYKAPGSVTPQYKPQVQNPSYTIEAPTNMRVRRSGKPTVINKDTGEKFVLSGSEVSIGSSPKSHIKLSSKSVAKRHANFVLYEDGWAIEIMNSQYITKLNGKKVTTPQLLFDGDVIAIGDERLYFKS